MGDHSIRMCTGAGVGVGLCLYVYKLLMFVSGSCLWYNTILKVLFDEIYINVKLTMLRNTRKQ